MAYTSVTGVTKTERVVEKSRFIAYVAHAEGEAEAREAERERICAVFRER